MKKPFYAPLLRAKPGEFTSLKHLPESTKSKLLPLFDIPRNTSKAKFPKTDIEHLDGIVTEIQKVWAERPLMVDATSWSPGAMISNGEHVMGYLHSRLEAASIQTFPVIGYDRWDDEVYKTALSSIRLTEGRSFVLRLDQDAIEDQLDRSYFDARLTDILLAVGSSAMECIVLIDLADLSYKSVADVMDRLPDTISALHELQFKQIIVAGSSIPATINLAVKYSATEGYVQRKEMIAWQALTADFPQLVFGDYGVRSPRSNEEVIAPDTNGKIRYTIGKKFFIARGYSLRTKDKGAQHHGLAKKIIESQHYMGPDFSWGDLQISHCAEREFSGNSTTWIGIDTNHHLEMVVREVIEFLAAPKITVQS